MFNSLIDSGKPLMESLSKFFENMPEVSRWITSISRWIFVALAIFILLRAIRSLLSTKTPVEIWTYFVLPGGIGKPLTHWENVIGRSKSADINIDVMSVSRNHGTLVKKADDSWYYNDLGSTGGSFINGVLVTEPTRVDIGDTISLGGVDCTIASTSLQEDKFNHQARSRITGKFTPWKSIIALTIFQALLIIQLIISKGADLPVTVPIAIILFNGLMWGYSIGTRVLGATSFEIESIAFFLSTLGLAVVATSVPNEMMKQLFTIILGMGLFLFLCWYMRDLDRAMKTRKILVICSVLLLLLNILLGTNKYGAVNWVKLGGFSVQPSELIKIAYILVGAATLDELFEKKNLTLFLAFSVFCLGGLAFMGDFGTASIFFIAFLVISFLRSGDFSKLILVIAAAGAGGLMILRFKPYILGRFSTWLHAWDYPNAGGFQQVRTMSAGASGGLVGLGPGEGWLKKVAAADTDLVFGILCEEWGLIIGVLAILSIVTLGIFAVRSIKAGRSTFYTICACASTTMFIFQTILNVFGAVDILPLTGITFPFVSNGGTSMIASWGLLAFLKAADTRENASIAVKRYKVKGEEYEKIAE